MAESPASPIDFLHPCATFILVTPSNHLGATFWTDQVRLAMGSVSRLVDCPMWTCHRVENLEMALFKSFHHPRATFAYHWWQHLTTVLLPENKHEAKKGHRVIDLAGSCSKRLKYKKASCCLHAFSLCGVHWKCTGSVKRVPLASVFSEHLPSTGMSLFRNGRRQKTTLTHSLNMEIAQECPVVLPLKGLPWWIAWKGLESGHSTISQLARRWTGCLQVGT